jgi:hypothetical protein
VIDDRRVALVGDENGLRDRAMDALSHIDHLRDAAIAHERRERIRFFSAVVFLS